MAFLDSVKVRRWWQCCWQSWQKSNWHNRLHLLVCLVDLYRHKSKCGRKCWRLGTCLTTRLHRFILHLPLHLKWICSIVTQRRILWFRPPSRSNWSTVLKIVRATHALPPHMKLGMPWTVYHQPWSTLSKHLYTSRYKTWTVEVVKYKSIFPVEM